MENSSDSRPVAIVYVRVSTGRQEQEGHSLDEQARRLIAAAEQDGYRPELVAETGSGKAVKSRPQLVAALARLDAGQAAALFVLDLDRLSRSVVDFSQLLERSQRRGWRVRVLGLGSIDTGTPEGRMVAHTLAAAAQYEREMTAQRVTRQHEARRQRGERWGVTQGPKPILPADVRERIVAERAAGRSLRQIAAGLTTDGIPTARGGRWQAETVAAVLRSPSLQTAA